MIIWNLYSLETSSGSHFEFVMGDWLEPGKYDFGEVRLNRRLTDEETEEYLAAQQNDDDCFNREVIVGSDREVSVEDIEEYLEAQQAIYSMWWNKFCEDIEETD